MKTCVAEVTVPESPSEFVITPDIALVEAATFLRQSVFPTFLSTKPPLNKVTVFVPAAVVEVRVLNAPVVSLNGLLSVYVKVVLVLAVATNVPSQKSSSCEDDIAIVTLKVSPIVTP